MIKFHRLPDDDPEAGVACMGEDMCLVCRLKTMLDYLCELGINGHRYMALANQAHEDSHDE